jgi:mRNA interferase MazF
MMQGDIGIVTLDPTIGHEQSKTRPCVIIQCNILNKYMGTTIIAPITSKKFEIDYPNIVKINNNYLDKDSCIKIEQIRCIDKSRIKKIIGSVSNQELNDIKDAIKIVFNL